MEQGCGGEDGFVRAPDGASASSVGGAPARSKTRPKPNANLAPRRAEPVDASRLQLVTGRRSPGIRGRGWLIRRMLLLADLLGLSAAFVVAQTLLAPSSLGGIEVAYEYVFFAATLPFWVIFAKLYGLYDRDEERADHSTADDLVSVFHLVTVGAWGLYAGASLTGAADPNLARLAAFWGLAIALIGLGRSIARAYCRRQHAYLQNAIIVGAGDVGQLVARKLIQHPEYGINLVGFADDRPKERRGDLGWLTLLGPSTQLPELIAEFDVERVIIAFSNDSHEELLALIRSIKDLDVQIDIVPRFFEIVGANMQIHTVEGLPLVSLPPLRLSRSSRLLKSSIDVALAGLGLLLLSPVLLLIAAAIKLDSRGPVLFRQVRMGSGGRTFRILKFRTMVADAEERKQELAHLNVHAQNGGDARMFKLGDDPRITRVGAFLRRYSLDELPQLVNVLRGEMSLVGPRPLILSEDAHVADWARDRLNLKPGVTGLWQVLGRSDIPFDEMTKLDYLYVTSWSMWGDLRLILRTLPALFRARQAY